MLHWTFLWRAHNPDSVSQSPGANLVAGQIFQIWAGWQNNWKRLFPSMAVCGHWGGVIWWENMKNSISLRTHHTFTINPFIIYISVAYIVIYTHICILQYGLLVTALWLHALRSTKWKCTGGYMDTLRTYKRMKRN